MFEPHAAIVTALLESEGLASFVAPLPNSPDGLAWSPTAGKAERVRVLAAIARYVGLSWREEASPDPWSLPRDAGLDPSLVRHYGAWLLAGTADGAEFLVANPFFPRIAAELSQAVGRPVKCIPGDPEVVMGLIRRHYGSEGDRVGDAPAGRGAAEDAPAPVTRAVDDLLNRAVRERASDLHLEMFAGGFQVRLRVGGLLAPIDSPGVELAGPMISRIKVLAGLDIAESRRPQDGRIRVVNAGRAIDLRVSTLPTQAGESVVIRVLDTPEKGRRLEDLGLPPAVRGGMLRVLGRTHGLLVVTGPTGSGKTTTLYGALDHLNQPGRKILTVEDPVEYEVEGITQVAAAPGGGRSFATVLRAFLRHDPDVIMVGEIRDEETARVALQAALTGHLVLTTLHAGDTAGVVARLVDMGIEPYLIAAALQGVLAQRLVPRLCPECREWVPVDPKSQAALGIPAYERVPRGRGCVSCAQRGAQGRVGIYEWLELDDGLREIVSAGASPDALRRAARAAGMADLRADGLRLARDGEAAIEDLLQVT